MLRRFGESSPRRPAVRPRLGGALVLALAVLLAGAPGRSEPERGAEAWTLPSASGADGAERPAGGAAAPPEAPRPPAPAPAETAGGRPVSAPALPLRIEDGAAPFSLESAESLRLAALRAGSQSFDTAARAFLLDLPKGAALERARAAALLSPSLPAARMAYARALWSESGDALGALGEAGQAVAALTRHPDALPPFAAAALHGLAAALVFGGLCFLAVAAAVASPHAAHDLGDLARASLPTFARYATLGGVVLLPALLGGGWLGLGLGLFAAAFPYSTGWARGVLCAAALAVWAGAFPVTDLEARITASIARDGVAALAAAAQDGETTEAQRARLEEQATEDPLAAHLLALDAKRRGDVAGAEARYRHILTRTPGDPLAANNGGNARVARGDPQGAIALYEQGASDTAPVVLLFNLAQAYGRSIRLDDQERMLARAQARDRDAVHELTALASSADGMVAVDLPIPGAAILARFARSEASAAADTLRERFAPKSFGGEGCLAALLGVAAASLLLGRRLRASRFCSTCGGRVCRRCDGPRSDGQLCVACARLFHQPDKTDPALRAARFADLRSRQLRRERVRLAAALLVPGAAGLSAHRAWLGLASALACGLLASALDLRSGLLPDPASDGGAGALVFLVIGGAALCVHAASVALTLALGGGRA